MSKEHARRLAEAIAKLPTAPVPKGEAGG